jgi:hypothetical protein
MAITNDPSQWTKEDLQSVTPFLMDRLARKDYGSILNEAGSHDLSADTISQVIAAMTGGATFTPQQINSYANSPTGQQALQASQNFKAPTQQQPTQQAGPTQQPFTPPSFEQWLSTADAQKMQTEQGYLGAKAFYDQNVKTGRWGTSGPTDPYKGQSNAAVDINGQQFARTGMSFDEMMIDPMRRGFMQQAGITANDFTQDPTHGWVTPFDKFHSGVELPISKAKKGNIFTDVLGMRGGLGPILAGMGAASGFGGLLNALAAGGGEFAGLASSLLPEGGFQSLFSSLGANAAGQGGAWSDIIREFGLDQASNGVDMPWGSNGQNFLPEQNWASNLNALNADGSINWSQIDDLLTMPEDLGGFGMDFIDQGATVPVGGMPWEQLVQRYGSDAATKLMMSSLGLPAGAGMNEIMNGMDNMGTPDGGPTTNVGNPTPTNINTGNPFDLNRWISDQLIPGLIGAGGSFLTNKSFQDSLEDSFKRADPFSAQRPFYQDELKKQFTDPNYLKNAPAFQNILNPAMDQTSSRMASQGFNMSGNMGHELMKTGVNTSANYMLPLMDITSTAAGAKFGPQGAASLGALGAQQAGQGMNDILGNLGSIFSRLPQNMASNGTGANGQTPNVINGGSGGGPNLLSWLIS